MRSIKGSFIHKNAHVSHSSNSPSESLPEVTLYKTRYMILFILSASLFLNGEVWMTFGTVVSQTMSYFNSSEEEVTWFANVFLLAYAVEAIPCTFMPQVVGLKWTIISGCALNVIGAVFRLIGVFIPDHHRFTNFMIVMIGNSIYGLGQGFMLNLPAMVSGRWFGENERAVSTAVAYMSNSFGVGTGFLDIFLIMGNKISDDHTRWSFRCIAIAEAVPILIIFGLSLIFVKENPPTPPSFSEVQKDNHEEFHFWKNLKKMLKDMLNVLNKPTSCLALLIYSFYYGLYVSMFIYLSLIMAAFVKDRSNVSGYVGSIGIILSGFSTSIVGYIMNKTQNTYNRKIGSVINFLCSIPLFIAITVIALGKLNNLAAMVLFIFYFNFTAIYVATGSEILADVTYPIDPNVSTNQGLVIGNAIGVILTYALGLIPGEGKYYSMLGIAASIYLINGVLLFAVKFEKNRQIADRESRAQSSVREDN